MAHFHHFSICNQNQSISNVVIFEQNTKAIALLFGQKWLIFITFQSAIKINHFQIVVIFQQNTKAIALLFGQKWLIFMTFNLQSQMWSLFQSAIKNQSISNLVIFEQDTKAIALLFAKNGSFSSLVNGIKINQFQIWSCLSKIPRLFMAHFSSLFNLQSKSINFKCGHF